MKVYLVNGYPGCGKTTFEQLVYEMMPLGQVHIISSVDGVKQIAQKCGWDNQKTPKSRAFLSDLKHLLVEYNDFPLHDVEKTIKTITGVIDKQESRKYFDELIFFVDVREPAELDKFKQAFNATTIFINRDNIDEISNSSDRDVENYNYDIVIDNNGTIDDLKKKIRDMFW